MDFDCEKDAQEALRRWGKKLKYHVLEEVTSTSKRVKEGKGRPRANAPEAYRYRISAVLKEDCERALLRNLRGLSSTIFGLHFLRHSLGGSSEATPFARTLKIGGQI